MISPPVDVNPGETPAVWLFASLLAGKGDFGAGLTLGLEDLLDHDGHEAGVPVVGDEAHVLAVAEGKHHGRLERSLAEHGKALLVVGVVGAVGLAVELGAGLAPNLSEEEGVVDEDAIDALLAEGAR